MNLHHRNMKYVIPDDELTPPYGPYRPIYYWKAYMVVGVWQWIQY